MNKALRIALTKGRIEKSAVALFEKIGFDCGELKDKGRKLIFKITAPGGAEAEVLLAKPDDVITYIEHGVCDIGIVGKDTIGEKGGKFYELLDLGFGKCRFALAAPKDKGDFFSGTNAKIVATKYPNTARRFFESKNMDVEIIKIEGSVEVAPILGLADSIVDIVETGDTLRANGLEVIENISFISTRLIVNTASLKLRRSEIETLVEKLEKSNYGGSDFYGL